MPQAERYKAVFHEGLQQGILTRENEDEDEFESQFVNKRAGCSIIKEMVTRSQVYPIHGLELFEQIFALSELPYYEEFLEEMEELAYLEELEHWLMPAMQQQASSPMLHICNYSFGFGYIIHNIDVSEDFYSKDRGFSVLDEYAREVGLTLEAKEDIERQIGKCMLPDFEEVPETSMSVEELYKSLYDKK